ncbi:MAG: hypothetical protein FWG99_10325, partial [Treponema sp.]|nr:hypothetical protein [Treponema sp.]
TITFSTDEAGTAYYVQLANGASAPTGAAVRAGTSLGAAAVGANSKGVTLTAGARDIYVVVEDAAGNISAPLKIEAVAYIAPDTTAPVLSDGSVSRTSDTAATISFTTDEVGTAYYVELTSGATAPASATVRAGTSLGAATLGANSGKAVTLTAGARDIYVVVEDAAGNISAPLKIEAAAYDSSDPWAGFSAGLYLGAPESLNSSSTPEAVAANDLAAAVTYANANPAEYTLLLDSAVTITIGAQTLNSGNLTLIGLGSVRTISASATGYVLFTVNSGASLTLGSNITIQGLGTSHAYQLISITAGGKLVMKNGSTLTGNTSVVNGGAVRVDGVSAVFDMEGGIIHANYVTNASASGGGVCVNNGGTFNMRGTAEISDNHVTNPYGNGNGGGVFMYEGSFNMEGGTIRANSATGTTTATGGGVYYYGSATTTFSKIGGTIYGDGAGADSNVLIATTNKYGYAARVYFNSDPGGWRDRNTTADPGVILNDPSNSGWE